MHATPAGHWIIAREILAHWGVRQTDLENLSRGDEILGALPHGREVLGLVTERQAVLKDAWLTATGHKRPGMAKGLPLPEAKKRVQEIDEKMKRLLARLPDGAPVPDSRRQNAEAHREGNNIARPPLSCPGPHRFSRVSSGARELPTPPGCAGNRTGRITTTAETRSRINRMIAIMIPGGPPGNAPGATAGGRFSDSKSLFRAPAVKSWYP